MMQPFKEFMKQTGSVVKNSQTNIKQMEIHTKAIRVTKSKIEAKH